MTDKLDLPWYCICRKCAEKHGGKWPRGHMATWHESKCMYCGNVNMLANIGDWNWPDRKARGMRD